MDILNLEGLVAIMLTPFKDDGEIDEAGVRHLAKHCADSGLNGVVVLGSNGEFPYLRFEEKIKVMRAAAEGAESRIPVIAGASAWSTEEAVAFAREAKNAGCQAVMAALPLYFALEFDKVKTHFKTLADKGGLPIYFYYFPDVTGLVLSIDQLCEIASIDGVVGAKLTIIKRGYLKNAIRATKPLGWKVFSGTSFLLRDCLQMGGAGVFCPLPLVNPDALKELYEACKSGDSAKAKKLQAGVRMAIPLFTGARVSPGLLAAGFELLYRLPFAPSSRPIASHGMLKEALRLLGHPITNKVRRPYTEPDEAQAELVKKTLENAGWLE